MADTAPSMKLTLEGAQKLLNAAISKAKEMKVPQCICIVDSGGHLLTMGRMDGAFALSIDTALRKAQTAAAYGIPTGGIAPALELKLAIATEGKRVNLLGGLPVIVGASGLARDRRAGLEIAEARPGRSRARSASPQLYANARFTSASAARH